MARDAGQDLTPAGYNPGNGITWFLIISGMLLTLFGFGICFYAWKGSQELAHVEDCRSLCKNRTAIAVTTFWCDIVCQCPNGQELPLNPGNCTTFISD